jgi:hypothetical protein
MKAECAAGLRVARADQRDVGVLKDMVVSGVVCLRDWGG